MIRLLACLLAFVLTSPAFAALTIQVCGSSTYDCSPPDAPTGDTNSWFGEVGQNADWVMVETEQGLVLVRVDATAAMPVPAGWTAGVGGAAPVPPASLVAGSQVVYSSAGGSPAQNSNCGMPSVTTNAASACATQICAMGQTYQGGYASNSYLLDSVTGTELSVVCNYHTNIAIWGYENFSSVGVIGDIVVDACPSGYVISGSNCVLAQPEIVMEPSDGSCTVTSSAGTITNNPIDPDCSAFPSDILQSSNSVSAVDGAVSISIVTNLDGTSTVTYVQPMANGNTLVSTYTLNSGGSLVGVNDSVATGQGTASGVPAAPLIVDFPSDYARQGEAAAAAAGLGTKLDTLHQDLIVPPLVLPASDSFVSTSTDFFSSLGGLLVGAENAHDFDEDSVLTIFDFGLPSPSCSPFVRNIGGHEVVIDLCVYTEYLRDLLGWLFALFGAYSIFQTIFKPRSS